ncbi:MULTISPECIES: chromosomal replication initiator protein DnaA [unclassified Campylobacter]|uniref:chromosomal replication initiator protein DnaA n=1 Tax=unclassified Campylobacter TaxID=2593542 RepID=UPI0022E9EEC6|nr:MULTISPECIES: chromosomal replication initiator protein DnaA [unclassified Campylobacter]MDA3043242.1 chromosomal replication initiator protein DnaA [Campylobacter sp. JMF_09 ED2]MDA3064331.1 chromosomal replication initiator protein DnaA [Campylobacter sp. JMF_11 EL3]MDA3071852.1 chromosomal replication initiator protein DnaA [Campylobacter sp. VBCF_03 NA9]MDA3075214.1 chromosomal replication initiator protein DnaA [Campylobacter sp. JMF_05 ED3]
MAETQPQEILLSLAGEIPPLDYERYIKNLKFNEKNSTFEFFVYHANNELVARYIQTKYAERIKNALVKKFGVSNITVKITSKAKISPKEISKMIPQDKPKSTIVNDNYTFENFIVADSNKLAFSSAVSAAKNPGNKMYNPLFLYGPSGLGKTHLLQSIANHCIKKNLSVICVTSEQFVNEFISNLENQTMDKFKHKYRNCDILLIDDIQFLVGKSSTIEEFFFTFNELREKKCQIVLTSDIAPKYLKGFEERMISRFSDGLIADIMPPELETKIAIIKRKSEENNFYVPNDVIQYIAANMGDNIREIEGALNKLNAFSSLVNAKIDLAFAKTTLQDQIKEHYQNVDLEQIISVISKELNVKPSELKSKTRAKNVIEARQICIYLAKILTKNSMPKIASYFNLKDHSAISKNIKKINETIEKDEFFKIKIEELKNKITQKENNEKI